MITLEKATDSELHFWVAGLDKRNGSWGPQTAPQLPWEFGRHGAERALEDRLPEHSASWPENGSSSTCLTSHKYVTNMSLSILVLLLFPMGVWSLTPYPPNQKCCWKLSGRPFQIPCGNRQGFMVAGRSFQSSPYALWSKWCSLPSALEPSIPLCGASKGSQLMQLQLHRCNI